MFTFLAPITEASTTGPGYGWLLCLATGGLSMLFLLLLDGPARRLGLIDRPSGRKAHAVATPLTGGLAILLTYGVLAGLGHASAAYGPILAATLAVGLLDDRFGLSPRLRLLVEAATALMLIYTAGTGVSALGDLLGLGPMKLGLLTVPFTVLVIVGLINAINMVDGLDGLAAGISLTSLGWMLVAVVLTGASAPSGLPILIAAIGGFMLLNSRHPFNARAIAFLGDSGSMVLGVCLGWYAITLSQGADRVLSPVSVLWILGLPVVDTLRVMFTRPIKRKHSPFSPGRDHFHHVLLGLGLSPGVTAWTIVAINAALGAVGVFGPGLGLSEPAMTFTFLGLAGAFWIGMPASRFIGHCGCDVSNCAPGIRAGCTPALRCWPKRPVPVLRLVSDTAHRDALPLGSIKPVDTIIDLSAHATTAQVPVPERTEEIKKRA